MPTDWRIGAVGIAMCFGVLIVGLLRDIVMRAYNIEYGWAENFLFYGALTLLFFMGLWFSLALWGKKK